MIRGGGGGVRGRWQSVLLALLLSTLMSFSRSREREVEGERVNKKRERLKKGCGLMETYKVRGKETERRKETVRQRNSEGERESELDKET